MSANHLIKAYSSKLGERKMEQKESGLKAKAK